MYSSALLCNSLAQSITNVDFYLTKCAQAAEFCKKIIGFSAISLQVAFLQRLVSLKKFGFTLSLKVQSEDLGNTQPFSFSTIVCSKSFSNLSFPLIESLHRASGIKHPLWSKRSALPAIHLAIVTVHALRYVIAFLRL
ncbi:MAG: hypothetical protein JSW00_06945 [Thermoplasmata archaeon]|nr:MAG: hypothetical protein JSW00_06945 [Thermoplasmata archaeon]